MLFTFEYTNENERNHILEENSHLFLREEKNVIEGNFLVFSENPFEDTKTVVYINVPKEEFIRLKQENTDLKETIDAILTDIIPSLMA